MSSFFVDNNVIFKLLEFHFNSNLFEPFLRAVLEIGKRENFGIMLKLDLNISVFDEAFIFFAGPVLYVCSAVEKIAKAEEGGL